MLQKKATPVKMNHCFISKNRLTCEKLTTSNDETLSVFISNYFFFYYTYFRSVM